MGEAEAKLRPRLKEEEGNELGFMASWARGESFGPRKGGEGKMVLLFSQRGFERNMGKRKRICLFVLKEICEEFKRGFEGDSKGI